MDQQKRCYNNQMGTNEGQMCNKDKIFLIFNLVLLSEPFGHKARFVSLNNAIRASLDLEDLFKIWSQTSLTATQLDPKFDY